MTRWRIVCDIWDTERIRGRFMILLGVGATLRYIHYVNLCINDYR